MPASTRQDMLVIIGVITGATGAFNGRGATSVRNGAGDYSLTYDGGGSLDALDGGAHITLLSATGVARYVHTSDNVLQVLSFDIAGAAADRNLFITVWRFAP